MKDKTITDCFVDEVNIKDIPPLTYCVLWRGTAYHSYHLLYGPDVSGILNNEGVETELGRGKIIFYTGKETSRGKETVNLPNYMAYLNYLTFNGFELISFHPSSRSAFMTDSFALLRKTK